ncbi:hypothetical protein ACTFIZ_004368 [Dictyostelium cf. discoideum]
MSQVKITIDTGNGESTISGKAIPLPAPRVIPSPIFLCFVEHETKGTLWDNQDFHVKSGKVECGGEEFDIPLSEGSWDKYEGDINVRIRVIEEPKKPFQY